ncbi:MAG: hypothetical protein AAF108_10605 [Planctomycetota bacterium]
MPEASENSPPSPPRVAPPPATPRRAVPTRACINAPVEICFRGRIDDARHLSVDALDPAQPRRVLSAPRLSDLPVAIVARLTLDPRSMSATFAFAGGGLTRGHPFTFAHEVPGLWGAFRAGGLAWTRDAAALPDLLQAVHRTEHESFRFSLDLRRGWHDAEAQFDWKRAERADDAPAWLDRHASGRLHQAWSPTGHAPTSTLQGTHALASSKNRVVA